ncbi:MAG: PAS domain S-box protein [Candidatus Methanoperedens sp.]|nr:PAS domain S-box protein [Candidatus Methanoperedens sp.]
MTTKNAQMTARKAMKRKNIENTKALEALRNSDEKYRFLFDAAPVGIGIADLEGNVLDANRAMQEMSGYTLEELKKTGVGVTYVDPEERKLLIRALVEDGNVRDFEVRLKRKDGIIYLALLNVDLLDVGSHRFLITTARDITESRHAENTLIQSEEKYRMLVENIQDGVFIIQDAKFQYVNEAYARIAGFTKEEMIGMDFRQFIAPEDIEMVEDRYLRRLYGEKVPDEYEIRGFCKNGTRITASMRIGLITYQGRVASMGIARDVTESKRAELALQASEKKYSTLVEKGNDGIVIVQDGMLKFANTRMAEITGFSIKDAIGKPFIDFIYPDFKGFVLARYKRRIAGEDVPNKCEIELISKDGKNIPVEINASLIEYDGELAEMAIIRDITERKQVEKALEAAITRAEEEKNKSNAIISAIGDGIIIQDTDYKITYQNQIQNDLFGNRVGEYCYKTYGNEDTICKDCPVELSLKDGKIHRAEKKLVTDGVTSYFEFTTSPLRDSTGKIVAGIKVVRDITDRRRAEEKIREAERFLESIFASIQDGIGIIDKDMNIIRTNPTAEKWYPHNLPLVGKKCYEAYHSRSEPCESCPAIKTLKTGESAHEVVPKSGAHGENIGWVEIYSFPMIDSTTGQMRGAIEYVRDITERKRIDEALRLYSNAVEEAPDGVQIVNLDGHIIYSNKAVEKIYGFSRLEFNGKHVNELNVDSQFATRVILPSIQETGTWEGELMVRHKDGRDIPIWLTTSMVKDTKGKPIAMVGVIKDITDRKRAEEALKESETRYRTLFENAGDAIFILDTEEEKAGSIVAANQAAAEMHGYSINELLAMKITELDTPDIARIAPELIQRMLKGEKIKKDIYHRRKDNTVFPVEMNAGLLELGDHKYILAFDRDITKRKLAEEAITKYTKELEESNRMKELFIDIMHHDLLNPLNTANGYIEILKESETNPEKIAYLETVKRNLVKGMDLIDNATRYSRLEGLESIELEYTDLKVLTEKVIETLVPLATGKEMEIENYITRSMPARCNRIIGEVFENFISNAIKYASMGKKVVLEGEDGGKSWRIKIIDFGEGINDTDKARIFERFNRMDKTGVKGSGLGLAIAMRIVELHNGRTWVEDNPEGGAVFVVEIPKYLNQVH